jgi:hypothetical protein
LNSSGRWFLLTAVLVNHLLPSGLGALERLDALEKALSCEDPHRDDTLNLAAFEELRAVVRDARGRSPLFGVDRLPEAVLIHRREGQMKKCILAALALTLAACATPYQTGGFAGGVSAAPLGQDTFRIQAQLNAFSNQSMVQDYLLLRAAETAQQHGAVGFVILGSQDTSQSGTFVTPGSSYTTGSAYRVGNSVYGSATTTYTPAQAYNFVKPGGLMMIRLVREPVPEGVQYFSAAELIAAIGPRVRR